MDIIKSEASWTCKNEFEAIPITDKLNCYRSTGYVNNEVVFVDEGFTFDKEVTVNKDIKKEHWMMLCKKEIVDFNLNTPFGYYGANVSIQKSFVIDNPFTFLCNCPDFDYGSTAIFVDYKIHEGRLMDLYGNYLPQGIVFTDVSFVDNENYDLDAILKVIENHPKVKMLAEGKQAIPWYNASEERNRYLKFMYIPEAEEFDKAVKSGIDLHHFALQQLDLERYRKDLD